MNLCERELPVAFFSTVVFGYFFFPYRPIYISTALRCHTAEIHRRRQRTRPSNVHRHGPTVEFQLINYKHKTKRRNEKADVSWQRRAARKISPTFTSPTKKPEFVSIDIDDWLLTPSQPRRSYKGVTC